jgi:hypothetical protein
MLRSTTSTVTRLAQEETGAIWFEDGLCTSVDAEEKIIDEISGQEVNDRE